MDTTKHKAISSYRPDAIFQMGQSIAQTLIITALKDAINDQYWEDSDRKYTYSIINLFEKSGCPGSKQTSHFLTTNYIYLALIFLYQLYYYHLI